MKGVVGVAGVLAFSVSGRTREFGIRLVVGSTPSQLLTRVLREGGAIVAAGITAGTVFGYVLARVASTYLGSARMPGALAVVGAAAVLTAAAVIASLVPAARASRVDVLQALRTEQVSRGGPRGTAAGRALPSTPTGSSSSLP